MYKYDVSILILTYNPSKKSLTNTLISSINQKNLNFEIVIADDGSSDFDDVFINAFFKERNFDNYKIVKQKHNKGTVQNYINSMNYLEGEYVKCMAPGDLLYDDNSLSDFYSIAKKENHNLLFGNSIYYFIGDNKEIQIYPHLHHPYDISFYQNEDKKWQYKFLIYQDIVVALSYFFKTELLIRYLKKIDGFVKYAEDTIFFLMVADGIKPYYYNRNIVWYEYGSGISTNGSDKWNKVIKNDIKSVGKILVSEHPEWKLFDDIQEKRITPKVIYHVFKKRIHLKKKYPPYKDYNQKLLERYVTD